MEHNELFVSIDSIFPTSNLQLQVFKDSSTRPCFERRINSVELGETFQVYAKTTSNLRFRILDPNSANVLDESTINISSLLECSVGNINRTLDFATSGIHVNLSFDTSCFETKDNDEIVSIPMNEINYIFFH